ncbi:YraN family protein [Candidatus Parabeggiatoa sp. HSG14]|uniref:YraN family protein n=1 Tax=Candidatus Parabeggiatoa sp. HSG14 TaxID=3055593 RepID=UPI0032E397A8
MNQGQWAENLAYDYLCGQGLQFVERNYHCKAGEIDLIMQQREVLVFVEVRYRRSQRYGGSLESIDFRKQQRIIITANHYLQAHQWTQQYTCRFDVVLISGMSDNPQLRWISDAFRMDG